MNKYGRIAKDHWQEVAPERVAQLTDPESYFLTLGSEVETQVNEIAASIAGQDVPGESYLDKVGRLNMAQKQAEEIVLKDLVWISPEAPDNDAGESSLEQWREAPQDAADLALDEEWRMAQKQGKTPFQG